jgi:hypothetical protein
MLDRFIRAIYDHVESIAELRGFDHSGSAARAFAVIPMRKTIAFIILGLLLAFPAAAQPGGCTPVTYPASPLYQSLALTDSRWSATLSTLATNAIQSPTCALTGATLTETVSATQAHYAQNTVSVSFSGAKQVTTFFRQVTGTRNVYDFLYNHLEGGSVSVGINLSTCTILSAYPAKATSPWTSGAASASFLFINGATWCKVVMTFNATTSTQISPTFFMLNGNAVSYVGGGTSSIGIWGYDFRRKFWSCC